MLAQAPAVAGLNRISVVSCAQDLPSVKAAQAIYTGVVDAAPRPSPRYFLRGLSGHLMKETCRLMFRAPLLVAKPKMDETIGCGRSDLAYAGLIVAGEMIVHPFDTMRVMWQAGQRLCAIQGSKFLHLYKGAAANGAKQFITSLMYPSSERLSSQAVRQWTPLDPDSVAGIALKAPAQSLFLTSLVWGPERVKNELQYRLTAQRFGYWNGLRCILTTQGPRGFLRGFAPKWAANSFIIAGANILLAKGREGSNAKR
jgi:hypothetical protein